MKKLIILVFFLVTQLIVSGCGNDEKEANNKIKNISGVKLGDYIKSKELPKNMELDFDPALVTQKDSAKVYDAAWLKPNAEQISKNVLRFEILTKETSAFGPAFKAGNDKLTEYLNVHDGVIKGGSNYTLEKNGNDSLSRKIDYVISSAPGFPDSTDQIYKHSLKSDYAARNNLDFMEYTKAEDEIGNLFNKCGFPTISLQEVYSLDIETMKSHYQLYLNSITNADRFELSKDDECYYFHFRQTHDGIPFINVNWDERTQDNSTPTETVISAVYSKEGITSIYSKSLYQIGKELKEDSLINGAEALDILLNEYSKSILVSKTKLVSMELNYIAVNKGGNMQVLPAWVFCISTSIKDKDVGEIDQYTYYVIDAFTGSRIRTAVMDK